MRLSKTTGTRLVATLRGLSRATARSPADAPDPLGIFEIGGMQRRGEIVVALHRGALARDRRHREAVTRARDRQPRKPLLVASTMPPMPAEADAPSDLLTPLTARPAASAALARSSRTVTAGRSGSSRSRSGKLLASSSASARPANASSGATFAMATRALREFVDIGGDVVGRHHRLAPADKTRSPTSSLSERSDTSTAPSRTSTAERHRTHRHRVGAVGAGAARGLHQAFGKIVERGLIEKRRHRRSSFYVGVCPVRNKLT